MSFLKKVSESLTNEFYENELEFIDDTELDEELAMEALGTNSDDLLKAVDLTDDEMDAMIDELAQELEDLDEGILLDEEEDGVDDDFESALEALTSSVKLLDEDEQTILDDQSIDTGIDMINDLLDSEVEDFIEDNYLELDDMDD